MFGIHRFPHELRSRVSGRSRLAFLAADPPKTQEPARPPMAKQSFCQGFRALGLGSLGCRTSGFGVEGFRASGFEDVRV